MSSERSWSTRGEVRSPLGGLIRTPARPDNWVVPGPRPAPAHRWADAGPRLGEDLCFLSGDWRILQRIDGHRFSLDDLVTAWVGCCVMSDREVSKICDLGCGIGSVLMMAAWRFPSAHLVGVEAQEMSASMATRSIEINGIQDRCRVIHSDFREVDLANVGPFDLITGTPPYIPLGDGIISKRPQCGPCRHEFRGGVEAYCVTARRYLAPQGQFVMCQAAGDRSRVQAAAKSAGLTISTGLEVIPRMGRNPLFSVFVMTAQRPDTIHAPLVMDRFVVRDEQGRRTTACRTMRDQMGFPPSKAEA